jgi:hypothetical protein
MMWAVIIFHSLSSRFSVLEFFIYGVYIFLHFPLSQLSCMQSIARKPVFFTRPCGRMRSLHIFLFLKYYNL